MKQNKQFIEIIVLAALVLFALLFWFYENKKPASVKASTSIAQLTSYTPLAVDNPSLQLEKRDASRKTEYQSSGRDLFSEIAPPPPVDPVKVAAAAAAHRFVGPVNPPPPPPPPPPTLPSNVKFFGYGTIPNGTAKRAFLADGDEIYIVAEGDTLLRSYRVVKINNTNLEFEEISSGRRNTIPLDEQAAPSASSPNAISPPAT